MLQQVGPGGTRHQLDEPYRVCYTLGLPNIALQKLDLEVQMGMLCIITTCSRRIGGRALRNFGHYSPFQSPVPCNCHTDICVQAPKAMGLPTRRSLFLKGMKLAE
ncbi:hypothetical protein CC80DRAFT_113095 [Byssothecium circinans]|uniref:Uncharacterized protein n=1 Tax=Byssothecium circinans TaxID=147558 RepID=A0A6A5TTY6_9PLEO|nr:hypothetical protein CC80DRAFT_113095 [Byssothecium circinans]